MRIIHLSSADHNPQLQTRALTANRLYARSQKAALLLVHCFGSFHTVVPSLNDKRNYTTYFAVAPLGGAALLSDMLHLSTGVSEILISRIVFVLSFVCDFVECAPADAMTLSNIMHSTMSNRHCVLTIQEKLAIMNVIPRVARVVLAQKKALPLSTVAAFGQAGRRC